ncbi:TolC family outer membrane protein [Limimaricola sp.]|uniref:TolC family outer membrane protein n=1 Tax=Limimaricola sp. TaxID=2211665 RepID=UPI0034443B03
MNAALAIAALTAGLVSGAAARAETLADALTYAYDHSGLLDQNRALLRAADEGVAQANAALMPIINWSLSATKSYVDRLGGDQALTGVLGVSAQLTLYDNGANNFAIEAQKESVLSTRQGLLNVEQQVLLAAVQAYVNVTQSRESVALQQNNVRVLTQELRATQDQFDVGEVTRTDVAQAQAGLAASRSQLAAAQGQLQMAIEAFTAAVGRAPGNLQPAPMAPVTSSVDQAKAFAAQNHPQILAAQHSIRAAELSISRAQAAMKPSLGLSASVQRNDLGQNTDSLSLTLSGPIYQGGLLDSKVRQLMANRDAARAGLHVTTNGIVQQVGNAYANLSVASASLQASQQRVDAAQTAFDGVREEARLGSRTTLDVLNAEQTKLDAQASVITSRANQVAASYSVLASMGLLTAEHLHLPVQSYDPDAYYNLVKGSPVRISPQGQALDRVLKAIGQQ